MSLTRLPNGLYATPLVGANPMDYFQGTSFANPTIQPLGGPGGNIFFVDGDNGADGNNGLSPMTPKKTIGAALLVSAAGAVIYIKARNIAAGGTDPVNYAETITIGPKQAGTKLIGIGSGVRQAAQPQIKKGSGSTPLLTIQAPGCLIQGITFNGISATGGGIKLVDDGSTMTAEGTIIDSCEFKNCVGSGATDATKGGAIWTTTGGVWDMHIKNCFFYDNVGGVVVAGASNTQPNDWTIENCLFTQSAAGKVDCDIITHSGDPIFSINIIHCVFGVFPSGNTANTYIDLIATTTGVMADCFFGCTGKTFGAAANVIIPTTVLMAGNYQEHAAGGSGEIGRT